jgi:hypothetical protein
MFRQSEKEGRVGADRGGDRGRSASRVRRPHPNPNPSCPNSGLDRRPIPHRAAAFRNQRRRNAVLLAQRADDARARPTDRGRHRDRRRRAPPFPPFFFLPPISFLFPFFPLFSFFSSFPPPFLLPSLLPFSCS